jgi:hypothetical protein
MRPPCDSKRSAGFEFASLKQKKIPQGWRIILAPSLPLKVLQRGAGRACFFAPPQNRPWEDDMRLISLRIGWDVARPFMMDAALTVSPPDSVKSGGNGIHDFGGCFRHFGLFSSVITLMIKLI